MKNTKNSLIEESAKKQRLTRTQFIEKWLEALESGEYRQGTGNLKREDGEGNYEFCCLGVACELAKEYGIMKNPFERGFNQVLPHKLYNFMGITDCGAFVHPIKMDSSSFAANSLTEMNDRGEDFKTIARIIREQLAAGNFEKP